MSSVEHPACLKYSTTLPRKSAAVEQTLTACQEWTILILILIRVDGPKAADQKPVYLLLLDKSLSLRRGFGVKLMRSSLKSEAFHLQNTLIHSYCIWRVTVCAAVLSVNSKCLLVHYLQYVWISKSFSISSASSASWSLRSPTLKRWESDRVGGFLYLFWILNHERTMIVKAQTAQGWANS